MKRKDKQNKDNDLIGIIVQWYHGAKTFGQLEKENNLVSGTLSEKVKLIPDYKGTRRSVGPWLRKIGAIHSPSRQPRSMKKEEAECSGMSGSKKNKSGKATESVTDVEKIQRQLLQELEEARKTISILKAEKRQELLRREFLEGQIEEYRKLVKPSESKKSNTK